jgi:acetylserotonin N-methyltransferase
VLDLLDAFRRSKAMFAAVSLGVFDRLAAGPATLSALARDLHADPSALKRLLDACVALDLLAPTEDGYANTAAATAYLCSQSPARLTGYIRYSDAVLWRLWDHLDDAVREGSHRWKQTFGWEGPIFDHFFRSEQDRREFLMGMHGLGQLSSPRVVEAFDLGRHRRLADLGGATGHLAVAACRRWPELRAVIFDLPPVLPLARELIDASGVADRIEVVAGDFFTDPLPDADLVALGRILHDWSEEKIGRLLRRVYERLPPGGALLVAEKLLDDDNAGPPRAVFQSLNMLVCTEGRERTFAEYEALLHAAGFPRVEGRCTESPLDAMLALKAD